MFSYISEIYMKFGILLKKDDLSRLFVSEIIDYKKRGYLNAQKVLYQKTYGQSTCETVRKTSSIFTAVFFSYFSITLKENQLQIFCFSSIWNLETVC